MRAAIFIVISLTLSSCASLSFRSIASLKKGLNIAHLPTQSGYPGAKAVIILDETDLRTVLDTNYAYHTTVTVRRIERVFSDIGKESSITIRLNPGQTLLTVRARTVEPDGKVLVVKSSDFHVTYGTPARRSVFRSDGGTVKFDFPGVVSGAIVEYAYRLKEDVPFPNYEWVIQRDVPVMRNVFSIIAPAYIVGDSKKDAENWVWNFVTYNYPQIGNPVVNRVYGSGGSGGIWQDLAAYTVGGGITSEGGGGGDLGNGYRFTWTLKDVPAFISEPDMPPKDWYRGYVQFAPSYWQSWDDLSKWYYEYNVRPSLKLTGDIIAKADSLVAGARTVVDTLDDIYSCVQSIRYSENKRRLGTLAPEAAETVLKSGEGDCRGKAMLLVALLRAVGISAKPAIMVSRSGGQLDPSFPCWRFHRTIVGALISGNRIVWFDPAAKYCGVGVVPPQDEDATVLVLNENGNSFFVQTPASKAWDNMITMKIDVSEHLRRPSEFSVDVRYGGEAGLVMRNRFADSTSEMVRAYCESMIGNTFSDSKLVGYSISPLNAMETPLTLKFAFDATNSVAGDSGSYSVYADPFPSIGNPGWMAPGNRIYPVQFPYPYTFSKAVNISLADSALRVAELPRGIKLGNPDFDYSSSYSVRDPDLIIFREVLLSNDRLLQSDRYLDAVNLFEEIAASKTKAIELIKK